MGGNLITKLAAPVSSVTVTYANNPTTYAQTNGFNGGQSAGIGRLSLCV